MCGIGGCVAPPGSAPDRGALRAMADAMAHRGPDDQGIEIVGNVGLVHRRLAIVDPSPAGHEPMRTDAGSWLTFNGEVFNHLDLRRELPGAYRGDSDAETLVRALEHWGQAALDRLNGFFALAFLGRDGQFLLARDRFGVKPLYVAEHGGATWFASEINALFAAGVPRLLDQEALLHATRHGWVSGRETAVAGIERVSPGHLVSIDVTSGARRTQAWFETPSLVDPQMADELAGLSESEVDDRVEAALLASVESRLMADVPLGSMCSGGLDSSLITAMTARLHKGGFVAFNASVPGQPDVDEGGWARLVADHVGVELATVEVTPESWCRDLVSVVRHVEYPLTHESSVPMWQIADNARRCGVKVLLSGEGADEAFGGYPWIGPRLTRRFQLRRNPLRLAASEARWRWRNAKAQRSIAVTAGADSPTVEAFSHALWDECLAAYPHHRGSRKRLEAWLMALLGGYLPHLLNRQDKSTMKASIETREPFLETELLRLAMNLPLEARVEPEPKAVLRRVAARYLPPEIGRRDKAGFGFDYGAFLASQARPGFIQQGMLRDLHPVTDAEWKAMVGRSWELPLWTAEIWLRQTIGGESDEAVNAALWGS